MDLCSICSLERRVCGSGVIQSDESSTHRRIRHLVPRVFGLARTSGARNLVGTPSVAHVRCFQQ